MLTPFVLFHSHHNGRDARQVGRGFTGVLQTRKPDEVLSVLAEVERAVNGGKTAAGFVSYEAACGIDPCLKTHSPGAMSLAWFALFDKLVPAPLGPTIPTGAFAPTAPLPAAAGAADFSLDAWRPSVSEPEYRAAIARIKDYIAAGDTYQVNYTLRLLGQLAGPPAALFDRLCKAQQARHCALIETDDFAICSASPELFFSLDGRRLVSRPMKGTAPRGMTYDDDQRRRAALASSPKDRAENAMIVDMMRNDMGRVADAGSVAVESCFDVEPYPTALQMTSTVACRTGASFVDIMRAMFPCASITGAPKIRTMEIIRELERGPRGVYCGCIGWLAPGRRAEFNVAIRTVCVDRTTGPAEYGVGGGIVWDSSADAEYAECRTKSLVLSANLPEFQLLESLRYDPTRGMGVSPVSSEAGYFLLDEHMDRLAKSAAYFGFAFDAEKARQALQSVAAADSVHASKVRLRVDRTGRIELDRGPLPVTPAIWRVRVAAGHVDLADVFLYHKTTNRRPYDLARADAGDCHDVLLWNARGEVTETLIGNIVIEYGGRLVTPPVDCGLLDGVFRQHLLKLGEIHEQVITPQDVLAAPKVFVINSVRRWMVAGIWPTEGTTP